MHTCISQDKKSCRLTSIDKYSNRKAIGLVLVNMTFGVLILSLTFVAKLGTYDDFGSSTFFDHSQSSIACPSLTRRSSRGRLFIPASVKLSDSMSQPLAAPALLLNWVEFKIPITYFHPLLCLFPHVWRLRSHHQGLFSPGGGCHAPLHFPCPLRSFDVFLESALVASLLPYPHGVYMMHTHALSDHRDQVYVAFSPLQSCVFAP